MSPTGADTASVVRKRMTAEGRREQILHAARRAFVTHGFAARTRDIAAEAGVNEALLYRHFRSKEELFAAAVVDPLERAVADLTVQAGEPPEDPSTSLDEMVTRARGFVRDLATTMEDVAPLLGVMLFSGEQSAADHFRDRVAPVLEQVADVIRTNLGWWEHRPFDPDHVVRFLLGAVWFEATAARMQGRRLDPDHLADELATMVVLGLAQRA